MEVPGPGTDAEPQQYQILQPSMLVQNRTCISAVARAARCSRILNTQVLHDLFFGGGARHLQDMEVSRLGVELELQLLAYTTATALWDPSHILPTPQAHSNAGFFTH